MSTDPELSTLSEIAATLVSFAQDLGATHADAAVQKSDAIDVTMREGAVERIGRHASFAASVRVGLSARSQGGTRVGFATAAAGPRTLDDMRALAERAVTAARIAGETPYTMFADVKPRPVSADALQIFDPEVASLDVPWVMAQARALDDHYRCTDGISGVSGASSQVSQGAFALASAGGFVGAYRGTRVGMSVSGFIEDSGRKQSEGYSDGARSVAQLLPVDVVARRAAKRTLDRRGARKVSSCTLPVIFEPAMARSFWAAILQTLCGDAVVAGRSFLEKAMNETLTVGGFTIVDDPHVVGASASAPFDGEGHQQRRRVIIDRHGQLCSFFLDTPTAARLGLENTANAARGALSMPTPSYSNVVFEGGAGNLAEAIANTKRGIVVTAMMGRAIDPVTGDISRGAAGFMVEDGVVTFPVEEITISGHARELLRAIDFVGADADLRAGIRAPTLRIARMQVSGS